MRGLVQRVERARVLVSGLDGSQEVVGETDGEGKLTNPVGLVDKAGEWPGATALPAILTAKPIVAARPEHFFRDDDNGGEMPRTVEVTFSPPPDVH